jgi:hypothetical protein
MGTRMHSDLRDGDHRGARLRAIALPLSPEGQWFRSRLDFSTMTDFTRVWHRAWVVRDCSHPGFGPPAGGHGATVQRGCSDRGRRVPVLRRTGIRVTSSTLRHASLLPFRPTRTCLSDHRRQQLHRSADRHHRRGSNPPRTRPVHESRALTRRGHRAGTVAGDCGGLGSRSAVCAICVVDDEA